MSILLLYTCFLIELNNYQVGIYFPLYSLLVKCLDQKIQFKTDLQAHLYKSHIKKHLTNEQVSVVILGYCTVGVFFPLV